MLIKVPLLVFALLVAACGDAGSSEPPAELPSTIASSTAPPTTTSTTTSTTVLPPPSSILAETTTSTTVTVPEPAPIVAVPPSEPPVIDGVIGAGEWEGAAAIQMSDGATAHLLRSNDTLYVGIAGDAIGAVNVVIAAGDTVSILHSSAALGSAVYARDESSWELLHGFDWCCRRGSDESAREALFNTEGWEANIGYAGDPGVVEYAIAIPWQDSSLAISSIRDDDDKGFWPADLSPEAQDQLLGVPPQQRKYNIEEWGTPTAG